jgi:chromosome segregation protein
VHLRKLEMRGFKTFADKTEMVFSLGTTAIVGPNGVGKSNVTDAILWTLGEQSPRNLRTESLQDVIFAGSERRRRLNMAEVHLTLDNSDHVLPCDYSEVVISRRVYRDGDSEYLINSTACRLRDVRDLLLDTGVGPKAYSVVGQGEIDAILSIRAEDRRELLEEVAGVRKYRVRRTEAERKLDATQVNLTRLADILHELRSQREPLEKQADLARQYKEIDEKLRKLELYLLGADFRRHSEKRGQMANEVAIARADLQATRNLISQVDAEYQKLAAQVLMLEKELERVRLEALRLQREAAEAREQRAVTQERLRALQVRQEVLAEGLAEQQRRREGLVQQNEALQSEHSALQARLGQEEALLARQQAEFEECRQAVLAQQQRTAELDEQRVKMLQGVARLENEAAALGSLEADLTERIARLESQRQQLDERLRTVAASVLEGEQAAGDLRQQVEAAGEHERQMGADVDYILSVIRDQSLKRTTLSEGISRLESREKVLQELRAQYEGYSEGTRHVMAAAQAGKLSGIRGVLGELLEVPEKFEAAIEAALGDRLQWIIVNTQEDALRAIDYLRAESLGRAAFFPVVGPRNVPEILSASSSRGCLGLASKLIKLNKQIGPAIEGLLGRILICTDMNSALETHRRFGGRQLVVTLGGEMLDAEGALWGGALEGGASRGFGRQRELETLQEQIAGLKLSLGRMQRVDEGLEAELSRMRQTAELASTRLNELRSDLRQSEGEAKYLQDQRRAALEAREETEGEIARLVESLTKAGERREEALTQVESLRRRLAEMAAEAEQTRAQAGEGGDLDELNAALTQRRVLAAEVRQKVAASQGLCQRSAADLQQAEATLAATTADQERVVADIAQFEKELNSVDPESGDDLARAEALELQAEERAEQLARLRDKTAEADAKRRELMSVQESQTERLHETDLSLTRAEAQLQALTERLADTYEMTMEQALQITLEDMSETQARREAAQLRAEIRRLGPVNLSSIDECERLSAREQFLQNQQDDLLAAKADLLAVIQELDEAAQVAFMETFERVATEFDDLFKRLFQGGATELTLTTPDDPLNSGVDVIVTPPGKKQQNLLLLSGGERAMTALALLFALLRVKPSPFCVMDEIDAALDAANTDRFAELLQDFSQRSQFIVITHNPRTMEKMQTLHGITMQEPGVSKLISVELEQAQKAAETHVTAGN